MIIGKQKETTLIEYLYIKILVKAEDEGTLPEEILSVFLQKLKTHLA